MKLKQHRSLWKGLLLIFIISGLIMATQQIYAQDSQPVTIKGTVTEKSTNLPLPGVTVFIKGTTTGTSTDGDGHYSLSVTVGSTLTFTYIGYQTVEKAVSGPGTINVDMAESLEFLDEVVVIGYGSTTKKEVTGSITSLKTDDFNKGSYNDPIGLLQGKVAGLSIAKPDGADPLADYEIMLRGTNTLTSGQGPLIIVDGVAGGDLKNINFEEVESMDVLKDGSAAAIYGTRGTNGVIIITTKRAKEGASVIEYSGQVSAQVNTRWIENLNAGEFEYAINKYAPDKAGSLYGANTDWFGEITRDMPITHRHNLALSGGNESLSHRTVLSIDQSQGILKDNESERVLIKSNVVQKALDGRLKLDANLTFSSREYKPANYDLFYQAFIQNPTQPIYDVDNTDYGGYSSISAMEYYNPVAMLNERVRSGKTNDMGANARATLDIIRGLTWVNFLSSELSVYEDNSYKLKYYPGAIGKDGEAEISNGRGKNTQYENTLNYTKTVGKHNIQALGGYSYQEFMSNSSYMVNSGFDVDGYLTNNMGAGVALSEGTAEMGSYKESSKLISFFGRAMYNYDDKYLLSASLRREGSSKFGVNNKWGWFPALSLGWRIDEEDFMDDISWVNSLKLRLGYGVTGNQEFDPYRSLIKTEIFGKFFYNGQWINSYGPKTNPNPDLRWEKKHEFDLGVDFSLLNNRLFGTADLYYRTSVDLLYTYDVSMPPYIASTLFTNIGTISNTGVELTLTGVPVKNAGFEWNTIFTASANRNKLVKISNEEFTDTSIDVGWIGQSIGINCQRMQEGESLGTFYGPVWKGLDESGYDNFKNENPIGYVNYEDWEKIGNAYPVVMLSWSNNFRYKNWNMSFALRSNIGGKVLNTYRLYYENWSAIGTMNIVKSQLDHPEFVGSAKYSSKYVEDATFLKLDNISVSYDVPLEIKEIDKLRVFATAQDLFCITGYKGLDPEVSLSGLEPGIEYLSYYPWTTTVALGLNVTF